MRKKSLILLLTMMMPLTTLAQAEVEEMPQPPFPVNALSPLSSREIPFCKAAEEGPFGIVCMNAVPLGCMWYCMDNGEMELRPATIHH